MNQSRLQSPVVWAAVASHVLGILISLGVMDTGLSEPVHQVVTGVLYLLTILGVLNNPTDKKGF